MIRPATRAVIEKAHRHSAFYRGFFANHLPMALVALDAMGASDERIAAFAANYERQLEPIGAAELERVDYFDERLAQEGIAGVMRDLGPAFAQGIGSAAFHGAIRTAYAIDSGVGRELAHGLAYWAAALERLPDVPEPHGMQSPLDIFDGLSRDPLFAGKRPGGNGIAARMAAIAREPSFASWVARLDPDYLDIDQLATPLIRAYCASGDFTLLHGVTGCHAFRIVAPFLPDPRAATRHLWTAIVAAYRACGSPRPDGWGLAAAEDLPWPDIHRRAVECNDEHDIKFTYSCWREWQRSGEDLYRRAASARVCHALAADGVH